MTRSPWAAKPSASLLVICDFLTVFFLASPDADFITGQTIDIDGGKSMLQWHREWPTAGVFATVTSTERRFAGTVVRARRRIEDASVAAY
jgi:hypothetical protein